MNPILPNNHYVPDAEARVWADGKMYLYGSYDICKHDFYCSDKYHVFSSSDLTNWIDHGVSFTAESIPWHNPHWKYLFAPDCLFHNGLYYLYFCMCDGDSGVASSSSPYGPFKNAVKIEGIDEYQEIDPAVLVDDDNSVYYYWGQHKAKGAKMLNPSTIDKSTLCADLITEEEHGFHEGASIRKRNGIYYLVYTDVSRGAATCLSYATSNSPLGPFKKGGVIINNTDCDAKSWNNHGSIAEFNGQWYIFYHRSSQRSKYNRRVCVEPIYFNKDGSINEVEMTTQGISNPINAGITIDAYRACILSGSVGSEVTIENGTHNEYLSHIKNGDFVCFKYLDFKDGFSEFEANVSSVSEGGKIEIRLDNSDGKIIGICDIKNTNDLQNFINVSCEIEQATGVHSLYLVFKSNSEYLFNLKSFKFKY